MNASVIKKYVLDQFQRIYEIEGLSDVIDYNDSDSGQIVVPCKSEFFSSEKPYPDSIEWIQWHEKRIPVLFGLSNASPLNDQKERIELSFDLFACCFYFLSGWQEWYDDEKDNFGRSLFVNTLQSKHGFSKIPVVNYYFDILHTALEKSLNRSIPFRCWSDKSYAVHLSHDIDKLKSGWLEDGAHALKNGQLKSFFGMVLKAALGRDTWDNVEEIIALERKYDARSTMFYLPNHRKSKGVKNADYKFTPKVLAEIERVERMGWEAGVHGSFGTGEDLTVFLEEIERFPNAVKSNRFHFLGWNSRKSINVLERSGLKVDCTLGYAEAIGFRNGIAHPFQPFNISENRKATFIEIPLHVMDTTLRYQKYMALSPSNALEKIEEVLLEVRKFKGCLGLLWHNNYFTDYKYAGWREVYENLLGQFQSDGAQTILSSEFQ